MKASSLHEIKKEVSGLSQQRTQELLMRLAKYKKENKELLTYLLFEADDEEAYKKGIKEEISQQFAEMNRSNLHLVKKSVRKILRAANKHIKYSGSPQTAAEILIYFCAVLRGSGIELHKSVTLLNLYQAQVKKIDKALEGMHEDLQYDYVREMEKLR